MTITRYRVNVRIEETKIMSLVSVSEYAMKTKKDPGNIRRMLAEGRLSGMKIGKQWVIEEDADYPADKRILSGDYRNYRNRVYLYSNKKVAVSVRKMIRELRDIYGTNLVRAVLYGSYARGDETEESDVDIALLIDGETSPETNNKMIDCVAKYELESEKVLSVLDVDNGKYTEWMEILPFYRNIKEEGIVLWTRK